MIVPRTTVLICLLIAGIVGLALPASGEELVVATFGGTFVDNSKKCHATAFEKATGASVKYVLGSSVQTMAKLRAAGARADFDVAYMDSQIVKQAKAEGLLQPLETAKIEHWNDLYDASRDKDGYWVSMMFAGTIITYNTNLVKTPPTSWADLWKPEWKGKLAIPDISGTSGQQFLMAAARLNGGSVENIEPGFEAIKKLKPNIQMMYTQPDQIIPLFERGDIALAVWYTDRTGAAALEGRAGRRRLPERGRDRHRADGLGAQGQRQARPRAEVHRGAPLPGGPALLRPVAVRRAHQQEGPAPGRPGQARALRPARGAACSSPIPISWRRSSRSGRSAGGARSRVDPAEARRGERAGAGAQRVRRLRKSFGSVVAVDEVCLDVAPGEFLSLLGPSGCGKTHARSA